MSRTAGGVLGVRTADGAVVPLLDFRLAASGRAIFTTTADGQRRAVFEFYFRAADASGWTYLDSLCLPRIPPARAGEPDLELRAGLDPRGDLVLHMHDPASSLPESFVLEAAELRRLLPRQPARSPRHLRLLLTALLLGAGLLVGGFTLLRDRGGKPASPAPDTTPTVAAPPAAAAPAALPEADPAKAAAADATPTTAPPASPSPLPTARHPIAWGDTLWRIAERYYGERDLYRELAESNSLGDPDRIVAGQTLLLPPALADRERKPPGE